METPAQGEVSDRRGSLAKSPELCAPLVGSSRSKLNGDILARENANMTLTARGLLLISAFS